MNTKSLLVCLGLCLSIPRPADGGRNPNCAILLHTGAFSKTYNTCALVRASVNSCTDVEPTQPPEMADAIAAVFVYQSASDDPAPGEPGAPGLHLTGVDFGLDYDPTKLVLAWFCCGYLEVPTYESTEWPWEPWPLPGSGNTVVWQAPQRGEFALVGFFHVWQYGAATLHVAPHPNGDVLRVLDDVDQFDPVSMTGVAGFGGAAGGSPCQPVAVRPASWGRIKSQYHR